MSFQDLLLSSLNNIQSNNDIRGVFEHILTSSTSSNESQWCPLYDIIETEENVYIEYITYRHHLQ